jgi:hypothetical protein
MSNQHRQSGWVHHWFGELPAENLLLPRIYARLRLHFMLRPRSKYAVTLYEILEVYLKTGLLARRPPSQPRGSSRSRLTPS